MLKVLLKVRPWRYMTDSNFNSLLKIKSIIRKYLPIDLFSCFYFAGTNILIEIVFFVAVGKYVNPY